MRASPRSAVRSPQKVLRAPGSPTIEPIADGVWLVRGGLPRVMNVYLLEDEDGVTLFDAGIKGMANGLAEAADRFGGINRIVLGHGHTDHRGAAPALDAPVYCHPDEVEDAEGSGGFRYWPDLRHSELPRSARLMHPFLHRHVWDGALARESVRNIAELEPALLWAGHGDPVEGDVASVLRRVADTT